MKIYRIWNANDPNEFFEVRAKTANEAAWAALNTLDWCVSDGDDEIVQDYIVLYRREDIMAPADPPFAFKCMAEDTEHAEEQLLNAEPDADIVWVVATDSVDAAYSNYWGNDE